MVPTIAWLCSGTIARRTLARRPSLAARLAALRPDAPPQVREATAFASPTLERLLVPPLRAAGSLGLRLCFRVPMLRGGSDLLVVERELAPFSAR